LGGGRRRRRSVRSAGERIRQGARSAGDAATRWLRREKAILKRHLEEGAGPPFGWVGPELCIPPLASPTDFDDFVARYDRPSVEVVHSHWPDLSEMIARDYRAFVETAVRAAPY